MKKIMLTLAALVLSSAVFAEGLTFSGYVRAGVGVPVAAVPGFSTETWLGGDYFGGSSRVRLNMDYETEVAGFTARYQKTGALDEGYFLSDNIPYFMAYGKFFSGKLIVNAGKLKDMYTSTGGWEDLSFAGTGMSVVYAPIEGLYLSAVVSDSYLSHYEATDQEVIDGKVNLGDVKLDKNIAGFSAAYGNDDFRVTAGAHLAGFYYGGFTLSAIKDTTLAVECVVDAANDPVTTTIIPWAEFTGLEDFVFGVVSYLSIADGAFSATVTPAVSWAITDSISTAFDSTFVIPDANSGASFYATFTPSVTFKAGKKFSVDIFSTISTDNASAPTVFGVGANLAF